MPRMTRTRIAFISLMICALCVLGTFRVHAETAEELQAKIDTQNSEVAKLEQEIAQYTKQLADIASQSKSLSGDIKSLDIAKKKLLTDIKITQDKIKAKNLVIKDLELEIGDKSEAIDTSKSAIEFGIKSINEEEHKNILESILSEGTISDSWKKIDALLSIRQALSTHIEILAKTKAALETSKATENKVRKDLLVLTGKLGDQKQIVDQNKKEKSQLLTETKNKESNYQTLLRQKKARMDALQAEISSYEAKLKFILDPSKLPTGVAFGWPVQDVYITQMFGKTSASGRLYASGTHNGVDFKALPGTAILAMADGQVLGTGDTDITCKGASFGRWVFIKYNNGLSSTYGHLSLIKANEGDMVKRGDIVGYSGNTGYSTGPHLHVSVYASTAVNVSEMPSKTCNGRIYRLPFAAMNAYLDPIKYLPPLNGKVPAVR